jgi:hypothetical protein
VWIPDSTSTPKQIVSAGTVVEFQTTTFGLGMTPTIGVGGGFLALDMNVTWTDVPQLSRPAMTFVFGPRLGKNFRLRNSEQSVAIWAGGFRVKISSETNGSIALSEVFSADEINTKIDAGFESIGNSQQQVDAWWNGLSNAQQNNPVNEAKYNAANASLDKAAEILTAADAAASTIESSTVQYAMDKRPKDMWNFIVGGQYQYNKHWMLRGEFGFLGSRTQGMIGLQYRFGL